MGTPVKGEEALRKMAGQALGKSSQLPGSSEEDKDPLEEAQKFTRQMAANAIVEGEVEKSKASVEKAKAEAAEAKARAERARGGEGETGKTAFKISGGVNLGEIDLQKEREDAAAELRRMKEEADKSAQAVGQENQQLREEIHKQEMKVLEITLQTQIAQLGDMIKSNAARGGFMEQYNAAMEMAKTLGFSQPTAGGDLTTQIELKKLEFEQTRELRRMAREEKQRDREYQLDLRRYDDEREAKRADAERQKKRDDMIAGAPEVIGRAIARGVMESGGEGEGGVSTPAKGMAVEAGVGETGSFDCANCKQPVGIGPTAKTAVCAGCGTKYTVRRVQGQQSEEEE